jgi:hypothetical protein
MNIVDVICDTLDLDRDDEDDAEFVQEVLELLAMARKDGKLGRFTDFKSDEFHFERGMDIDAIETALGFDEDEVFKLYVKAYRNGDAARMNGNILYLPLPGVPRHVVVSEMASTF